ncbi:MAG: hypothetical protein OSB47_02770 [Pirellulaceae bacterium]|nr:hypothetical protein [Pirellulaceae bacterium]
MTRIIFTFRLCVPLRLLYWGLCCFLLHSFFAIPLLEARITVDAIPAQPFGIAEIVIDLPASPQPGSFDSSEFYLSESHGRALYPVFTEGRLRRAVGGILGNAEGRTPATISILFLFTGADPLEITLHTPSPRLMTIRPRPQPPRVYERTIKRWWREYHATVREQEAMGDYPPIVQTYLTSMLSRRLAIAPPLRSRVKKQPADPVQNSLEMLLGLESLRLASLRKTSLGERIVSGPADRPLPVFIQRPLMVSPPPADQVTVEEIASHVPRECFYIRFGSFTNYLWLDRLVSEYGGDLNRMVTLRGLATGTSEKIQQQLALKKSALAGILGNQVIRDVAIIGRDTFVQQGAAVGVLFQARNDFLGIDLKKQRAAALEREEKNGATLRTIRLAGREVSLLSTPDNRLRSYYAVDGAFHLVTTSQAIAERFLAMPRNGEALGATVEFQQARRTLPVSRDDTVFVYFSSFFLQGLLSPQYQVELPRRLQAATDLKLIQLAKLAAAAEKVPGQTIDELIQRGLLPFHFGKRVDRSRPITQNGRPADSLRGALGSFLPIPDVTITGITAQEENTCQQTIQHYQQHWKQMDPVMIGMKRQVLDGKRRERLVIDARIAPLDETKYGRWVSMLGPPAKYRISEPDGNVISVQASLRGGLVFPDIPPHTMFLGIRDSIPPTDLKLDGLFKTWSVLKTTPGYLGAWPQTGLLDRLPLGLAGQPDINGFSQFPLGLWRKQAGDGFSVIGFDPQLLGQVAPQLKVEPTETAAQVRIRVGDLSQARFAHWINALNYERARQTSTGNIHLLHLLTQQFGVPRAQSMDIAQDLLQARLTCSLGGEYKLATTANGSTRWHSTGGPKNIPARLPKDYQAPLLSWFRGLESSLTRQGNQVMLHAQLDVQRKNGAN